MIYWYTLKESIKLPNNQAMRNLNKIGMDITVIYMFILLFLASIPDLIHQLSEGVNINVYLYIIYFLIFYYLPLLLIAFTFLSGIAYLCVGITNLLKRKLRFSILWKLVSYTTTLPILLYTIIALFYDVSITFLLVAIIYSLTLIIIIILSFPKRRIRKK